MDLDGVVLAGLMRGEVVGIVDCGLWMVDGGWWMVDGGWWMVDWGAVDVVGFFVGRGGEEADAL